MYVLAVSFSSVVLDETFMMSKEHDHLFLIKDFKASASLKDVASNLRKYASVWAVLVFPSFH